jgi:hypothetical protein
MDKAQKKIATVMGEYKAGTLHSGSGGVVKNRKQAVAIAMSEADRVKRRKGGLMANAKMKD